MKGNKPSTREFILFEPTYALTYNEIKLLGFKDVIRPDVLDVEKNT